MRRFLYMLLLATLACDTHGQVIEVTSNAYLKHDPIGSSSYYRKMVPGDQLTLVTPDKTNGYYYARYENFKGYIYKTLVKLADNQTPSQPATTSGKEMEVHILDTGPALCAVIKTPNGKYIIYDAGYWFPANYSYKKIQEVIPEGSDIELMVLSHTDGDHISAAAELIRNYRVLKLLNTGFERKHLGEDQRAGYRNILRALEDRPITEHINLHERDSIITAGNRLQIDGVNLTFLCGFGEPLAEWGADLNSNSMKLNGVSIVMEMEYNGVEMMFCGDAVGRTIGGDKDQLIGTEQWLMDHAREYLKTDIMVAPHHGADNGSSTAFINATRPETVIFSAGHDHSHPTANTANRYLEVVDINNIYRTDRGDNEGSYEWGHESSECQDPPGDDDIVVKISNGKYFVYYKNPNNDCND